jgi:mono/diheme cytochrome c family protein
MRSKTWSPVIAIVALGVIALLPGVTTAAGLPTPDQVQQGKQVFAMNCSVGYCHGLEGRAGKGPRLRDRVWTRSYLYETIEKGIPNSSMPSWKGRIPNGSIDAIVAYVLSIGRERPGAATPDAAKDSVPSKVQPVSVQVTVGKALFFDLTKDRNCGVCHRIEGSGTPVAVPFAIRSATQDSDLLREILNAPPGGKAVKVTTEDGETICGVDAGGGNGELRIYDLASPGPPVLRALDAGHVKKEGSCDGFNVHQDNAQSYSTPELMTIVAFLRSSSRSDSR